MKEFVIIHFQVFWFCWADQSFFLRDCQFCSDLDLSDRFILFFQSNDYQKLVPYFKSSVQTS